MPKELQARFDAMDDNASAEDWKALGNACFSHGCCLCAIRCYTKALETGEDTAVIRSNRSAAYLKSPMFAGPSLALKDAQRAVELDAGWYKAHLRLGDAQLARKKYAEAKAAYQKALELDSRCEAAAGSLRIVERELFLLSLEKGAEEAKEGQSQWQGSAMGPKCGAGMMSDWSANSTVSCNAATALTENSSDRPPTAEEEIARNIKGWSDEVDLLEHRTAMRAFNARLDEADRETGVAYKKMLLSQFRGKVETQESLRHSLEERQEKQMRLGEGIDYRNADRHRNTFMKGTNGIGLGISTDAYKSYKYESKMW